MYVSMVPRDHGPVLEVRKSILCMSPWYLGIVDKVLEVLSILCLHGIE